MATTPEPKSESGSTTPFYRRWWFIALAVIVGLALIGGIAGGGDQDLPVTAETSTTTSTPHTTSTVAVDEITTSTSAPETTTTTPASTTTTTSPPTTTSTSLPPGPEVAFGSGIQVVGEDIQPGIYETGLMGEGIFDGCYWERLSGFSGDFDELIANNNAVVHDVVEVADSDVAFNSDCDAWYELTPLETLLDAIPQGKWVVGVHISSGTYQAEGGEGCYWERLSGVSGEFDHLIANDLPTGAAIVEIRDSDFAFNSSGCGEWNLRS